MPTADFSKNALIPQIHTCFEPITATWQYIVADPETHEAVVIDSVLDFNPSTSRISTASADNLLAIISKHDLKVIYIMETHAHADHLTAAHYIQQQLIWKGQQPKPSISVGKRIDQVQATFARKYNIDASELTGVFDHLWDDNEKFSIGNLRGEVLYLPGHTPDHVGYRIEENVFTGDSIFNPDVGSARADFPGGSVTDLYNSTQTLLSLPSHFRLYTGHDYPPESREVDECGVKIKAYTTVEEQLRENKHVKKGTAQEDFVNWRAERDAMLGEPRLLHQAMQVNVRGGRLPKATVSGDRFLSIPMKVSADVLMLMG